MTDRRHGSGHTSRLRLSIMAVVAVALFASLFARLYELQVVGADEYRVQAETNRVRNVHLPAPRGRILDRNGKVIVDNRVAVMVSVDRAVLGEMSEEEQEDVLWRLSVELTAAGHPTDADQIRQRLNDNRFSRYAPVPVALDVSEDMKIFFDEHADEFPSVVVDRTAVRAYPFGPLAVHTLGYVGKINEDEFAAHEDDTAKPYDLNDMIGKAGVEQTYEEYLRGTPGVRRIEVDAEGNAVRVISEQPPQAGDDLVLSIDADLQALAEQKVLEGLATARGRTNRDGTRNNGTNGSAVVIDPNNGQVLAMASFPGYDPNLFADGVDDAEWEYLNNPENGLPLNNWAIQGEWAPGSSYKPFVAYSALMAGVMQADTVFMDGGGYQIPGCSGAKCYRSNAGGAAYGAVTIDRALTVSSDAYFYNVGAQFWLQRDALGGDDVMQSYLWPWGFGDQSGIHLTSERPGRVPTRTWKREFCDQIGCNDGVWRAGDNVNMAIGQGDVLVTPLQLANAYATFANGGTRYVPQIAIRAQKYMTDEVTKEFTPEVVGQVPLPPEVRQPIYDGLYNVPISGTATRAFAGFPLAQFPVAGKTGTAQVDNKADTAVFAAFGPAPAPRYAMSVFLAESGFGGTASAPVSRALFDALAGVTPLQPVGPDGLPSGGSTGIAADTGGSYD